MSKPRKISGTFEWASSTFNCVTGCSHNCRYCYARHAAETKLHTVSPGEWKIERIVPAAMQKSFGKRQGTIMFPTAHDITPAVLEECIECLKKMLEAGNHVLIVSKPHFDCINAICHQMANYRGQILFRFTIGARDNKILRFWEPGAPLFEERFASLMLAYTNGFRTSISMEPCLDWVNVVDTFLMFAPYVTDSIWIGTMNKIDERVRLENTEECSRMLEDLKCRQNLATYQRVYRALKDHPLIRWKESLKEELGLELAKEVGEDK